MRVQGTILAGVHSWGASLLDEIGFPPLLPVAARPLIHHAISWLSGADIDLTAICANGRTMQLCRALGDGADLGTSLHYFEDLMPRGPAGCAHDAMLSGEAELFVLIDGSVLPRIDLADLLGSHRESGAAMTVVAIPGRPQSHDGDPGLAPGGVYVCSRQALAGVPTHGYQDIKEGLIPRLHAAGERIGVYTVPSDRLPRIRTAMQYLTISRWAVEHLRNTDIGTAHPGYERVGDALVHKTARVASDARLLGPSLIGPRVNIGAEAAIVGPTTIGADTRIERQGIISRSTLWSGAVVGAGCIIDSCILTDGAVIEPATVMRDSIATRPAESEGKQRSVSTDRKAQHSKEADVAEVVSVPRDAVVPETQVIQGKNAARGAADEDSLKLASLLMEGARNAGRS
jgi:mannose-1-phosphate guanylyltransferase